MPYLTAADAWMHAHPYALAALAAASAHRKTIFKYAVLGAVKRWPWLLGKESDILADVDEFRADLKADMDAAAAARGQSDGPKAAAAPDAGKAPASAPPPPGA